MVRACWALAVVFQRPAHFLSHAVGARLHGHSPGQIEPNPAVPVSGIVAAVVAAHRLPQPQAALLNQIQQQHPVTHVLLGQLDHPAQAQIGQGLLGPGISLAAALSQLHLISKSRGLSHFL